ncbi:DinB family protein [Desertivirga xinjiangensis]|uniref:DinB family protein n=1 Tax=Desertivirga xinjiangensis TaxID=539206 RepID=UPI00210EBA57|nr:DinB family protein [Pedobacter xinjiangensis]
MNTLSDRAQAHLDIVKSRFKNQGEQELLRFPETGGWSIAQCLEHLNSYGDYYLPRIRAVLNIGTESEEADFRSGWLGNYFSNMMEPSEKKYNAFKGHLPVTNLDPGAVVDKFISQQLELLDLLRIARTSRLNNRIPISISPLIRLKSGDVFRFVIAHNERHMQQALRNLKRVQVSDLSPVPEIEQS